MLRWCYARDIMMSTAPRAGIVLPSSWWKENRAPPSRSHAKARFHSGAAHQQAALADGAGDR
jgi:hypothetical protein